MENETKVESVIDAELVYAIHRSHEAAYAIALCAKLQVMFTDVDLSEVSYSSVYAYANSSSVTFTLKEDFAVTSKLAHVLARKFHVKFEKSQNYAGDSLKLSATIQGINFTIAGYLGTCKLVTHEEPISEEEYQAALATAQANVKRVKITSELVCKEDKNALAQM